jgi:dynamin 1-like protein
MHLATKGANQELSRFRILREQVVKAAEEVIRARVPQVTQMVESLIEMEMAYINTNHKDFEGGVGD